MDRGIIYHHQVHHVPALAYLRLLVILRSSIFGYGTIVIDVAESGKYCTEARSPIMRMLAALIHAFCRQMFEWLWTEILV